MVVDEPSGGRVVAVVALAGLPALPLWWRWHSGAFRLSAGLIGAAVALVSLWAALAGGLLLLPTGLLLLAAALVPESWSLLRGLVSVLAAMAAVTLVPFLLYGAFTCVRPAPRLDVTLRPGTERAAIDAVTHDLRSLERRGDVYRLEFGRSDAALRDSAARRLSRDPSVLRVASRDDRCG